MLVAKTAIGLHYVFLDLVLAGLVVVLSSLDGQTDVLRFNLERVTVRAFQLLRRCLRDPG